MNGPEALDVPASREVAPHPPRDKVQAWTELLRTPLPHLELEAFAQMHPVRVDQADGVTLLRIQPGQEVKRALAPWTRRYGTIVPVFTSLEADASDLLGSPEEAARWLRERPLLCCAVPVLDDLLIAARGMTAQVATPEITSAARELAYAAAGLVVDACQRWPGAQIPWADAKNRPTLRLVAQAIDLALAAQDHERALAWMRWMLGHDAEDAHGWRSVMDSQRQAGASDT
ncbi:hypothetical protein [Ramlibacter sp.]|uniref:hypothetical protein n=1 Tax=Ramlibacter sp. TaxID=1917967 RepID=UPI002D4C355D|nr:hypothetical protein [Ramlibacter sp.]HYD76469.1 hypothetical protein [Ramlibacter sp.]